MQMHTLLILSVMIFAGMAFGRLAKLFRLPNVTGYLIAGLLLGPAIPSLIPGCSFGGIITSDLLPQLDIIGAGLYRIFHRQRIQALVF